MFYAQTLDLKSDTVFVYSVVSETKMKTIREN